MTMARQHAAKNQTVHHVSERQKRAKLRAPASIQPPLTPMIDVVFQLLLFFLIGCRFITGEGQLRANLPPINMDQTEMPVEPIDITLRASCENGSGVMIEISGVPNVLTEVPKIYDYLVSFKQQGVDAESVPVYIKPDDRVRWEFVVDAFNQAIRANYKNTGFTVPGG